jgi:WD40 repeat protein
VAGKQGMTAMTEKPRGNGHRPWFALGLAACCAHAACSRPNDDGIVDSVGRQRQDANELTDTLRFTGGIVVAGTVEGSSSDGPACESVKGPIDLVPQVPFSYRLAVAPGQGSSVRAAVLQWKYADRYVRIPLDFDPVIGLAVIDGVDTAEHPGFSDKMNGTVYLEDAQGRRGPGIPIMVDSLDPGDRPEPDSLVLAGHHGAALSVDLFERDGKELLASGGDDAVVSIWSVETGHRLLAMQGHSAAVTSLSATQDGSKLASASRDHTVRIWDSRTGELLEICGGHQDIVSWVAHAPDGKLLASGSWDGTVQIRDLERRLLVATLPFGHRINMLEFSADGAYLAVASGDMYQPGRVSVFDVADWSVRFSAEFDREVTALNLSSPPTRLTVAVGRGRLSVWDVASGQRTHALVEGPQDTVPRLGFVPDAPAHIGAISLTGHMFVWNLDQGQAEKNKTTHLWLTSADFSRSGRSLALADSRGVIWLMSFGALAPL